MNFSATAATVYALLFTSYREFSRSESIEDTFCAVTVFCGY